MPAISVSRSRPAKATLTGFERRIADAAKARKSRYVLVDLGKTPKPGVRGPSEWRAPNPRLVTDVKKIRELVAGLRAQEPRARESIAGQSDAYVRELKAAGGGAYSTLELAEKTGLTRQGLAVRRGKFQIVYWTDPKGHCFYPKWQFDTEMKILPGVQQVLGLLKSHDTLHVLMKFLVPSTPQGKSVRDLIAQGESERAVSFVENSLVER